MWVVLSMLFFFNYGFSYVPPKFMWCANLQYLKMWAHLEIELVQMKLVKLEWGYTTIGWTPNANTTGIFTRRGNLGADMQTGRTSREDESRDWDAAVEAKERQQTIQSWEWGLAQILLQGPQKIPTLPTSLSQTPGLQDCGTISFWCLSRPVCETVMEALAN